MLNSCGRISDPNIGAAILQKATPTAEDVQLLMNLNNKRKQLTNKQFKLAAEIIEQQSLEKIHYSLYKEIFTKGLLAY